MTAVLSNSGAFRIVESDAAVEAILHQCVEEGSVRIEDTEGRSYNLQLTSDPKEDCRVVTKLPDFAKRRSRLGTPKLPPEAEAEFFRLLRGE
jgi:hypothetical protein